MGGSYSCNFKQGCFIKKEKKKAGSNSDVKY